MIWMGQGLRQGARALALATGLLALAAPNALGDAKSLYHGSGPRPGPDILYAPPATSPLLQNRAPWRAKPILVSGTSSYRKGEFVYQDFLFDDGGASGTTRDPNDPRTGDNFGTFAFSLPSGTYTYPTDPRYAGNAADLVELRVKPLVFRRRSRTHNLGTLFRLTLNTMVDPSLYGATIALGDSAAPRQFPHGANAEAPAQLFLTAHGDKADLIDAASGAPVKPRPHVTRLDRNRHQVTIFVPRRAWNPHRGKVRLAAGVGLWDKAHDRYLIPGQSATATQPGGAGNLSSPPAFFNVAFRYDEPMPDNTDAAGTAQHAAWWRDRQQATRLASGDLSPFYATVNFRKLRRRVHDDMSGKRQGVPRSGPMDRILVSHFSNGQGFDYQHLCQSSAGCKGELRGQLQPYALYVPRHMPASGRYGMTLLLHSLAANYNQFLGSRNQSQFGERLPGSIILTPSGRGPDGWYYDWAGADTFEAWADVARRYKLDPAYTSIAGYSMGGYGTFKFATQFPDLFAKAQPTVGPPGLGVWAPPAPPEPGGDGSNTNRMLASVRNLPFLMWVMVSDELVPFAGTQEQARTFDDLGYRYEFDAFTPGDHLTLAINDQFQPAADFLGAARVNRNPAHVTYVRNPTMDFDADGTKANHAYWLSGISLRDPSGGAPIGKVDARSSGFGGGDPAPGATQAGGGALTGGTLPAISYTSQSKAWGPTPATATADRLVIDAQNIATLTIDPHRAKLDCAANVTVNSDGPIRVHLRGCRGDLVIR
jgi:hypothetical protein